jgi:hypothetical protein
MSDTKLTLGQAIDRIVEALQSIDETARPTVLATVCAHLGIPTAAAVAMKPNIPTTVPASVQALPTPVIPHASGAPIVDIRTLKTQKEPKSAKACLQNGFSQSKTAAKVRKAKNVRSSFS